VKRSRGQDKDKSIPNLIQFPRGGRGFGGHLPSGALIIKMQRKRGEEKDLEGQNRAKRGV